MGYSFFLVLTFKEEVYMRSLSEIRNDHSIKLSEMIEKVQKILVYSDDNSFLVSLYLLSAYDEEQVEYMVDNIYQRLTTRLRLGNSLYEIVTKKEYDSYKDREIWMTRVYELADKNGKEHDKERFIDSHSEYTLSSSIEWLIDTIISLEGEKDWLVLKEDLPF